MSVYVDPLRRMTPSTRWPLLLASHMWADTRLELFEMAEKLGLEEQRFLDNPTLPCYDLTASDRGRAMSCGAIAQTYEQRIDKAGSPEFRKEWNLD